VDNNLVEGSRETFTYSGALDLETGAAPYSDVALVPGTGGAPGAVRGALQTP